MSNDFDNEMKKKRAEGNLETIRQNHWYSWLSSEARNCHECRCQRSVSFTGRSGEMRAEIRRYQERCCVIHKRRGGAWENPDEKLSLVMLIVNDSVARKIERLYYPLTRKAKPQTMLMRKGRSGEASPLRQTEVGHMTVMTPLIITGVYDTYHHARH